MNLEVSLEELQRLIKCMGITDDEFGPIEDKKFYKLLNKLRKLEKEQCQAVQKKNLEKSLKIVICADQK